ncbi:MAG: NAD(P)-dependent oxidoreductase [Alphaproteobacteria bacterium]|nr:NAD(P)-dependent oxidoreductase [Alphaproteobacteria bacterium]
MTETVGLIGFGAMGAALFERLKRAGRDVRAYDVAEDRMALAREAGAKTVPSPAAAATGTRCVHVFVRTDAQARDAVLGPDGVLAAAEAGTVVFLHATINPETTKEIAREAAKQDVTVLDAAVTAVPAKVRAGEAIFLVGGSEDAVSANRHYLEPLGAEVIHFGPLGAGNTAKIAKNLLNAAERILLFEVMEVAAAGGLDLGKFMKMAVAADHGSNISRWDRSLEIVDNQPVAKIVGNIFTKDIVLAGELVETLGMPAPITRGAAATAAVWVAAHKAAGNPG